MGRLAEDLTGQRFGLLTVVAKTKVEGDGHAFWICRCDCGGAKVCHGANMRRGLVKSCGCLQGGKGGWGLIREIVSAYDAGEPLDYLMSRARVFGNTKG